MHEAAGGDGGLVAGGGLPAFFGGSLGWLTRALLPFPTPPLRRRYGRRHAGGEAEYAARAAVFAESAAFVRRWNARREAHLAAAAAGAPANGSAAAEAGALGRAPHRVALNHFADWTREEYLALVKPERCAGLLPCSPSNLGLLCLRLLWGWCPRGALARSCSRCHCWAACVSGPRRVACASPDALLIRCSPRPRQAHAAPAGGAAAGARGARGRHAAPHGAGRSHLARHSRRLARQGPGRVRQLLGARARHCWRSGNCSLVLLPGRPAGWRAGWLEGSVARAAAGRVPPPVCS